MTMTVDDVEIMNWEPWGNPPGKGWWADVEKSPDEPRIKAKLTMTLSLNEYKELIRKGAESAS